jgi:hypothetical protein
MGRVDLNKDVTLEADDSILDGLEDIDAALIIDMDMDAQTDLLSRNPSCKNTRRRLEDRLEDLRLQRQIADYNFNLH